MSGQEGRPSPGKGFPLETRITALDESDELVYGLADGGLSPVLLPVGSVRFGKTQRCFGTRILKWTRPLGFDPSLWVYSMYYHKRLESCPRKK
ncbi:hypothetical protein MPNT_360002 [Candidatus Methylacidithermus pantelleriae]|uniref:Uncharacterized protein n=1 Tax=Candidatus Methylacidithermus pantelleriae TaxID=2744239 RepID=A0A8J2FP55_9BACT|nr:hypothetical protein MPNT_360002 [Candidatus Methylacidithermus pantelleriae]